MSDHAIGLGDVAETSPANGAAAPATVKKSERGATTGDKQLVACIRIGKLLDSLSDDERTFALGYITTRYLTKK